MKYLLKYIIFSLLMLLLSTKAYPLKSDWSKSDFSKVRLISPLSHNNFQKELLLGLEYKMEPGWKTYWKSPGDGGFAQNIEFNNSQNVEGIEIKWPTPKKFQILGLNSLGYEDEIIFPLIVKITNPNLKTILDLSVNYLICHEICIPGNARIFLEIVPGKSNPTQFFYDVEKALSSLPKNNTILNLLNDFDINAFDIDEKILIKLEASSKEKFVNPEIFIHTSLGLPVVETNLNFSLDRKSLEASFNFDKNLIYEKNFQIEMVLLDDNHNITLIKDLSIKKIDNTYFFENIIIYYLIIALVGGFLLNAMPCVFPVLSLKLMNLINKNKNETRLSFLVTALGIIISFFILAIMFLILQKFNYQITWGMQFQQPYFLMFIAYILTLFMLNMFGLFDILLPNSITSISLLNIKNNKYIKDFFNGFFATLLATPCSAPFVGTALTIAFTQSSLLLVSIFVFMGIGMSLPYIFFFFFPKLISYLPKPGKWMIYVKYFLGLLLFLTLIWLFNILSAFFNYYFIISSCLLIIISIIVLKLKKNIFALNLLVLIIFFSLPYFDIFNSKIKDNYKENWIDFLSVNLEELIKEDSIIFLDITADWCATCQFNKINVVNKKEIIDLFDSNNVILLKADWTKPNEKISNFLYKYNKFGIPFNAFFSKKYPNGIILSELLSKKEIYNAIKLISNE